MPNTSNYNFEYESPSSLPGTTLTGGPGGGSPILAVQVDSALASIATQVDINADDTATNTVNIGNNSTAITNLENWTRRGTVLVSFTTLGSFTTVVNFGFTFPGTPTVITNIASSGGPAARWKSRAITTTSTTFTLFLYVDPAGATSTWADVPVTYIVHYD